MSTRYYSSTAAKTTISAAIDSASATLTLAAAAGLPSQYPFVLILEKDTANEEIVDVTGVIGSAYAITRGRDGSTAKSHSIGSVVEHGVSARDFTESRSHEVATTAHGVTGNVVGTGGAQTLASKTLTAPIINAATISGAFTSTATITGGTISGATITNLPTPTNPNDAATKTYIDTQTASAAASASSAATSASSSLTSANSSVTSATAAATSAASAATSASSASTSAASAATSASTMLASVTTAATSAASALASQTAAATSAASALTSQSSADASATSANTSATAAASAAATASASVATIQTSAASAATSASSAAGSAASSATSASLASQWATKTTGTVDGVEFSAKYYAQQANPVGGVTASNFTAKGVTLVGTGTGTYTQLTPASTNGFILTVDSATTSGLAWTLPNPGDVTGVAAGTGLLGGGTSGDVTLSLNTSSVYVVPSQTGNANKYLKTDGNTASWFVIPDTQGLQDKVTLLELGIEILN